VLAELRELWRFRELLIILIQRDLKLRYRNSVLGFGWSLVNPLVQVLTITLVMKLFLKVEIANYHAYLFCAMLPWLFFNSTLLDSSLSMVEAERLIRRVYFPREVLPLSRVIANLIHFGAATAVFLVYMCVMPLAWWAIQGRLDWPLQGTTLLLPVVMVIELFLVAGLSLWVAVANLYFEDTRYIVDNLLRVIYWLVPVIYFADMLKSQDLGPLPAEWAYRLYLLNPLAMLITAFRKLTMPPLGDLGQTGITGEDVALLCVATVVSIGVGVLGYAWFNKRKWGLAERP